MFPLWSVVWSPGFPLEVDREGEVEHPLRVQVGGDRELGQEVGALRLGRVVLPHEVQVGRLGAEVHQLSVLGQLDQGGLAFDLAHLEASPLL